MAGGVRAETTPSAPITHQQEPSPHPAMTQTRNQQHIKARDLAEQMAKQRM